MASVVVTGVKLLENPTMFHSSFKFEITFECLTPLEHDLEWKLTYVGSPDTTQDDQELDSVLIGPVAVGLSRVVFEAAAPNIYKLPKHEWIGTTVVLLECAYRDQIFFRVGYFVMNEYTGGELIEAPDSISQRLERQRKLRQNMLNNLASGDGLNDFQDFVHEYERDRAKGEESNSEDDSSDEEDAEDAAEVEEMIVDDGEEGEEGAEDDEEGEEDDEDDEEDSDEEGGKRPPGGKHPPAAKQPPGAGGKQPPTSSSAPGATTNGTHSTTNETKKASPAPGASTGGKHPPGAASAPASNDNDDGAASSTVQNKKRARTEEETPTETNGAAEAHVDGEQEPEAKRRQISEYPQEIIEAYIATHMEDGPRWYTNVDPLLIQRNVMMEDPRVSLFTIRWGDDEN